MQQAKDQLPRCDVVAVSALDEAPLQTAISPLPTALVLTRDALQGGRLSTPRAWRAAITGVLRGRDMAALAPLTAPGTTGWPSLLDEVRGPLEALDDALERLLATP